ncbi:MAG: hypothetical protein Q7R93_00460 [bacterium]|nr:hypothetical protein [bacterium]
MALFQVIGLGIAIFVLQVLAPEIWNSLQHLTLSVLSVAGNLVNHLQAAVAQSALFLPAP